jgi:hypothetical protein
MSKLMRKMPWRILDNEAEVDVENVVARIQLSGRSIRLGEADLVIDDQQRDVVLVDAFKGGVGHWILQ